MKITDVRPLEFMFYMKNNFYSIQQKIMPDDDVSSSNLLEFLLSYQKSKNLILEVKGKIRTGFAYESSTYILNRRNKYCSPKLRRFRQGGSYSARCSLEIF